MNSTANNRTKKSAKNVFTGIMSKIIVFVFAFASRTVFVRLLGAEYTGINGLYTNILSVLAMADLGINNVFIFTLYQPLASKDKKQLATLINSFKKVYHIIGFSVLGIGLAIIPFLSFIVKTSIPDTRVILYYILYLANTASTYFFCYKTTILIADQKQYYDNIMTTVFHVIMYGLQLIYLLLFRDYIGYLVIQVLCSVFKNFILSKIADKYYPFISDKSIVDKQSISFKEITANVKSTFVYKICSVLLNNTDNILISVIVGTIYVGYYSNYYLLIQYINAYVYILSTGLLASIGNVVTEKNIEKLNKLFNTLILLYAIIACVITCVFFGCVQSFIPIWLGTKYLLDRQCIIAIVILLYTSTVTTPIWLYREAIGLFNQVRFIMIPTVILNIILSIILGKLMGTSGIIYATSISKLLTTYWYEPKILYKYLHNNVCMYYLKQIRFIAITLFSICLSQLLCNKFVSVTGILNVLVRAAIYGSMSIAIIFLIYHHTPEFNDIKTRVVSVFYHKSTGKSTV